MALIECVCCGTALSVVHCLVEVVTDTQQYSFLEAITEPVDGDDYCFAA